MKEEDPSLKMFLESVKSGFCFLLWLEMLRQGRLHRWRIKHDTHLKILSEYKHKASSLDFHENIQKY